MYFFSTIINSLQLNKSYLKFLGATCTSDGYLVDHPAHFNLNLNTYKSFPKIVLNITKRN